MSSYSLADIQAELDIKYGNVEIDLGSEVLVLRPVLRLPKEDRSKVFAVMQAQEDIDMDAADGVEKMLESLIDVLTVVAQGNKATVIKKTIGDDLALAMKFMELYNGDTQPGEASNSPA